MRQETIHIANEEFIPAIVAEINAGHTVTLRLFGNSMLPFLRDGRDRGLLSAPRTPRIGDPVLAEIAPKKYVLHRVVAIEGDSLTLLGDGNLTPEHCHTADIRASVIGFYRKGRARLDRVDGLKWRAYSALWMRLRPIRRYLLAAYRRLILGQWRKSDRMGGSATAQQRIEKDSLRQTN